MSSVVVRTICVDWSTSNSKQAAHTTSNRSPPSLSSVPVLRFSSVSPPLPSSSSSLLVLPSPPPDRAESPEVEVFSDEADLPDSDPVPDESDLE